MSLNMDSSFESPGQSPAQSKPYFGNFPGGPVVKNPSCSAGNLGSISGGGTKIPHGGEQLSPHATATEPALRSLSATTRQSLR